MYISVADFFQSNERFIHIKLHICYSEFFPIAIALFQKFFLASGDFFYSKIPLLFQLQSQFFSNTAQLDARFFHPCLQASNHEKFQTPIQAFTIRRKILANQKVVVLLLVFPKNIKVGNKKSAANKKVEYS